MQRSWIAGALCVVVCASFAARAAGQVIEASYFAEPTAAASPPSKVATPPPAPPRGVEAKTLTDRNPFCSDCGPEPVAGDPTAPAATRLPLVLVATMRGPISWATIRNTETDAQGAYAIGSRVPGAGVVERIAGTFVLLRTATGLERVELLASGAAAPDPDPVKPPDAAPPPAWADRVHKIDDTTYEVDRDLIRELMTAGGKTPGVRVMPVLKDGKLAGIRVSQARKDSLAAGVGLRQGDVIQAIDGKSLDTANAALDAMGLLETASQVRVSLSRGGKPVELDYRLR